MGSRLPAPRELRALVHWMRRDARESSSVEAHHIHCRQGRKCAEPRVSILSCHRRTYSEDDGEATHLLLRQHDLKLKTPQVQPPKACTRTLHAPHQPSGTPTPEKEAEPSPRSRGPAHVAAVTFFSAPPTASAADAFSNRLCPAGFPKPVPFDAGLRALAFTARPGGGGGGSARRSGCSFVDPKSVAGWFA